MYVTDFLVKYFAGLMDYAFTAHMEEELDEIGDGEQNWIDSLREYYTLLEKDLKEVQGEEGVKRTGIPIDEKCPKCGKPLVIKDGRFGRFKACSGYPDCKFRESLTKRESKPLDEKCPKCGSQLVQKFGRFGPFVACSNYPKCKYIKKENAETGIDCPSRAAAGRSSGARRGGGRSSTAAATTPSAPSPPGTSPSNRPCPACGQKFLLKKHVMRGDPYLHCWNEKCAFKETRAGREDLGAGQGRERPGRGRSRRRKSPRGRTPEAMNKELTEFLAYLRHETQRLRPHHRRLRAGPPPARRLPRRERRPLGQGRERRPARLPGRPSTKRS